MQYTGTIIFKGEEEVINENLTKQTIVLEEITDREFKGWIAIDFLKDKTQLLSTFKVGDEVIVSLNFRANKSKTQEGKYFTSINGWRIEAMNQAAAESNPDLPF